MRFRIQDSEAPSFDPSCSCLDSDAIRRYVNSWVQRQFFRHTSQSQIEDTWKPMNLFQFKFEHVEFISLWFYCVLCVVSLPCCCLWLDCFWLCSLFGVVDSRDTFRLCCFVGVGPRKGRQEVLFQLFLGQRIIYCDYIFSQMSSVTAVSKTHGEGEIYWDFWNILLWVRMYTMYWGSETTG